MIRDFNSVKEYFQFAMAKGFKHVASETVFAYEKSPIEKLGHAIAAPIVRFTDATLRNLKNPVFITASTVVAIVVVSAAFYPAQTLAIIGMVAPPLLKIKAWMVKFAVFSLCEATIIGVAVRTFSRLSNETLMSAWRRRELVPISIGDLIRVR